LKTSNKAGIDPFEAKIFAWLVDIDHAENRALVAATERSVISVIYGNLNIKDFCIH
jgi:hypothetical protein